MELRRAALEALQIADPDAKSAAVAALQEASRQGLAAIDPAAVIPEPPGLPGRPARPALVPARELPQRPAATPAGRAALLHAICHIEFNAINLALDAVWRFAAMPADYYTDWMRVAAEEAGHFVLVRDHLRTLGQDYGSFAAHDGLWTMAQRTTADVLARMALVPRTMEARGLDATPPIQAKFARAGDRRAVAILDVILRDEIGHVAIGNRWFRWLCVRLQLDPETAYPVLAERHRAPRPRPPFNRAARQAAGFTSREIDSLAG